ncbi:Fur family transcriptional regulator [Psychrobacter sp. I-STPA10]|uniref:Fur family transcriptional regulator n=1 Tax=Psychrobacter sp. I-STPA10 TaxID=2585769 RepID=UPI001E4836F4|nr:Fur family transcriptional regulator [Psychrobacter sp. I-STPA10]
MSSFLDADSDVGCQHGREGHLHNVQKLSDKDLQQRLQAAAQQCSQDGSRFTELRRQVYTLILDSDKPLGAYDLIQCLQDRREKNNGKPTKTVAPPTIYRTLDFLLAQGFIHQLNSINAFVPCCHPRDKHIAAFLICEHCRQVQECSTLPIHEVVQYAKQEANFAVTKSTIEMTGRCADCQSSSQIDAKDTFTNHITASTRS